MSAYKSYFTLLINISLIFLINAQIPLPGKCPENIKAIEDFDAPKYLGKWYEYSKYPFVFEIGGSCIYAIYGESSDSNKVTVLNSQINFLTNKRSNITGTAELTDGPNVGKLLVKFDNVPVKPKSSNYWVLGTDYTSYSVVYSCTDLGITHPTVVWILTRDRNPSNETLSMAQQIIDDNKIADHFKKTTQTDCPADEH